MATTALNSVCQHVCVVCCVPYMGGQLYSSAASQHPLVDLDCPHARGDLLGEVGAGD